MKTKPELSDEEIRRYMDFNTLLTNRDKVLLSRKRFLRNGLIGFTAVTLGVVVWLWLIKNQPDENLKVLNIQQEVGTQPQAVKPKPVESMAPQEAIHSKTEAKGNVKPAVKHETKTNPPAKADELKSVYIQAEPLDGYAVLYEYFAKELVYPREAIKDSIQGIVTVIFTINRDGKPEKIQIENSLGTSFDRESIRVIENMPLWKPATLNGNAVPSKVSVPLTFHIKKFNRK